MTTGGNSDEAAQLRQKILIDAGNATSIALGKVGNQLGLYKAMGELGEFDAAQLAERTGTIKRYIHDWLVNQAAAGYISYNKETQKFFLSAAQKEVLTNESSANYSALQFTTISGIIDAALNKAPQEIREGKGVPISANDPIYVDAFTDLVIANTRDQLVKKWIPLACQAGQGPHLYLGGATPLLFAQVASGHGGGLRAMAKAYARSHLFFGLETDERAIEVGRQKTTEEKFNNILFHKTDLHNLPEPSEVAGFEQFWTSKTKKPIKKHYDIIVLLSVLHDLQDPVAVLTSIRERLEPLLGVCIIVEPIVKEPIEENFNTRGQYLSAASVAWCSPNGLVPRQDGKPSTSECLGTLATDSAFEAISEAAGFKRFTKLDETNYRVFALRVNKERAAV